LIAQGGDGPSRHFAGGLKRSGAFRSNSDGEDLVQGYKRAANILKAEQKKKPVPAPCCRASNEIRGRAAKGPGNKLPGGL